MKPMSSGRRRVITAVLGVVAGLCALAVAPATAAYAAPNDNLPHAVVSLGDSFISGEGAGLDGNPNSPATFPFVDRCHGDCTTVYGPSWTYSDFWGTHHTGCHRSDSSPIHGVIESGINYINLACSGATTWNVRNDGTNPTHVFKNEAAQVTQLAGVLQNFRVTAVFLTVGGNDAKLMDLAKTCGWNFRFGGSACYTKGEQDTRNVIATVQANLRATIDDIRGVMTGAGYANSDYKLIVTDYPNLLAGSDQLMSERSLCPFYSSDADWMRANLMPRMEGAIQVVAHAKGVLFMDVRHAFDGHELCNVNTMRGANGPPPRIEDAEWVNGYLGDISGDDGIQNQQVHPNHYGQIVLGECFDKIYHATGIGDYQCVNAGGKWAKQIVLWGLPYPIFNPNVGSPIFGGYWWTPDSCVSSGNGKARLCFQRDGNLVVYDENWSPRWSIGSVDTGRQATFQADGNLVVYDRNWNAVWSSGTYGNPGSQLYVQNDGNVIIWNHAATGFWGTGTNH